MLLTKFRGNHLSENSPKAIWLKKVMYLNVITMSIINLLVIWFALDLISKDDIFIYIVYFFIFLICIVYFKRDALMLFYFNMTMFIIMWIQCLVYPYFLLPHFIPQIFSQYWLVFSIGYCAILLRHLTLPILKYCTAKKLFIKQQCYLNEGVYYAGNETKSKPKLTYYFGTISNIILQIMFDIVAIFLMIFVMYKGGTFVFETMPLMMFKGYIIVWTAIVLAIIFAPYAKSMIFTIWLFLTAEKSKKIRFVFASDDT